MSNSAQTSASSRIAALLDENSFVEVGAYIAARNTDFNMTEQETPADGVVTGYGTIGGCLVYVYSQDAAVLGGSIRSQAFPGHATLHGRSLLLQLLLLLRFRQGIHSGWL